MANEKKAVCGGFLIGDGLQMDGKVLSASGGGGVHYVECHADDENFTNFQCELTPSQIHDLHTAGETIVMKVDIEGANTVYLTFIADMYFGLVFTCEIPFITGDTIMLTVFLVSVTDSSFNCKTIAKNI